MITFYSQNVWNFAPAAYRNRLIRELVWEFEADVCAFQECGPDTIRTGEEALPVLMDDIYAEVQSDLAAQNYTPLFYKRDKFALLESAYYLYDGLNDANSKSATLAVLADKSSHQKFAVISTHFWWKFDSEKDNTQRLQNVDQLTEICDAAIQKHNVPVIIGGDFNNGKNADQGEKPYIYMRQKGFCDIRESADETTHTYTHHDYPVLRKDGIYEQGALPVRNLDYIFTYGNRAVKAKKFDVITSPKALASSDHCPLVGQFVFPT